MKPLMVACLLMVSCSMLYAADYTITTSSTDDVNVAFWANRLGVTASLAVQQICATGFARHDAQRLDIIRAQMESTFNQMSPEDQASMCAIYATYGVNCPGM